MSENYQIPGVDIQAALRRMAEERDQETDTLNRELDELDRLSEANRALKEERDEMLNREDHTIDSLGEDYIEALTKELESAERELQKRNSGSDAVNHPSHYTNYGAEVILITEHMNFCRGNAVKYLCRAGLKDGANEREDLEKAVWYIQREISRLMENNGI
mgnify:FL=1